MAGAYIGAIVGAFMILSVSPEEALLFLIFILILQQLEGNLIYPRGASSSIGLPGILVLTAVTVGGAPFGVVGIHAGPKTELTGFGALRTLVFTITLQNIAAS